MVRRNMRFLSPGDLFVVSAMTGAVLLVKIGLFIIVGVI
jgi:hypothetical protein